MHPHYQVNSFVGLGHLSALQNIEVSINHGVICTCLYRQDLGPIVAKSKDQGV